MPLKQCPFEVGQCSVHHAFRCMQGPTISKAFSQARTKWRMRKIQVGYKILRIKNHLALLESIRTLIGIKTNISHSSYSVYAVILTRSSLIFSYFVLYYKFCWNDCSVWAEVNSSQRVHGVVYRTRMVLRILLGSTNYPFSLFFTKNDDVKHGKNVFCYATIDPRLLTPLLGSIVQQMSFTCAKRGWFTHQGRRSCVELACLHIRPR